jgi:hypothetical protein
MNPTILKWDQPAFREDGSTFTASDFAGFELEIRQGDNATSVAIPIGWNQSGQYQFPLKDLSIPYGGARVRMRTLAVGGLVSDWTGEVPVKLVASPKSPINVRVE